jgi:alkylation response protein AidB-like acyl-CoA dehydrogenase
MYRAPLKDIGFVLHQLLDEHALAGCPAFMDYSAELADTILQEAGKFAENVLDPLYKSADREGAHWSAEGVTTPAGFKDAYGQFVEGGWPSLRAAPEHGGQGMPTVLGTAVEELWAAANLAFKLCPMLTQGATEALEQAATPALQHKFMPRMVSGEWTGTMNLTEPQAGSDLAQVRTRAVREGDHFRVFGQKIFITYGDHDYTKNIIHMVLGRVDGAAAGVKGISLFLVPKVLVNDDGSLGERNDVQCISIEHKLGIHGSPTCVMAYGQKEGAIGYLIGEENRGLEYMFVMMNAARLSVGLEGYAVAERAFQQAAEWARTRVQGKPPVAAAAGPLPIIHHPDIKRMLLTMKSLVEAMRAVALYAAFHLDLAAEHADAAQRAFHQARGDLLIPVVKGWSTENGIELASLGIQVHGGMGFIEETGAAQAYRDVRITTIYEGTTGIQANDLIGRKVGRDRGVAMAEMIDDMQRELQAISATPPSVGAARDAALAGAAQLREATACMLAYYSTTPDRAFAVAVPYLKLTGTVLGGWLMARAADVAARNLAAGSADKEFLEAKLVSARFYAEQLLPQALALLAVVKGGAGAVVEADAALI